MTIRHCLGSASLILALIISSAALAAPSALMRATGVSSGAAGEGAKQAKQAKQVRRAKQAKRSKRAKQVRRAKRAKGAKQVRRAKHVKPAGRAKRGKRPKQTGRTWVAGTAVPTVPQAAPAPAQAAPAPSAPVPAQATAPDPVQAPAPEPVQTPAPVAPPVQWVGVNDISAVAGRVPHLTAASAAADLGSNSTRMIIDWAWIEPQKGSYGWGMFDGVYWRSLARGMRPLIGITGAPAWAWDAGASCPTVECAYPPGRDHLDAYREVVRRLAQRYPRAAAIEIGNEPNLAWAWAGGLDPARYTELLKVAYTAVKEVNPAMPVISGGLAPVFLETSTADAYGLRPFLQAMYDNGARGHMDGISIHPYPYSTNFSNSFKALAIVKDVRDANGDDVPLWTTEFGMSNTGAGAVTEGVAAVGLAALHRALRSDPEMKAVYLHTLVDEPDNPNVPSRGYGLLRADLTHKPGFCAIAAANGSAFACPSTVVVPTAGALQVRRWAAQTLLQAAADAARKVHGAEGAYANVTSADLHAIDDRLSPDPGLAGLLPGATADPSKIGVYPAPSGRDALILCNTSQADRSYCISTAWPGVLRYGSALGTIGAAYNATSSGTSGSW